MISSSKRRVVLAKITGVHGVKGQLKVKSFTSDPFAFADYGPLQLADTGRLLEVTNLQPHKDLFLVSFADVTDREKAEAIKGKELLVDRDKLPEPEPDEFYFSDLQGLAVKNTQGQTVGQVVDVVNFGAGDLLEIRFSDRKKTELLAFNQDSVPDINLDEGFLIIVPPDWMLETNQPEKGEGTAKT